MNYGREGSASFFMRARASNATFCNWKKKTNFDVVAAGGTIRDPGSKDAMKKKYTKIFTIFQNLSKKRSPKKSFLHPLKDLQNA